MKKTASAEARRKVSTPGIRINRLCLLVCAILFVIVCGFNLLRWERPTVSETENRTLAVWPEFSADALFDGSYFKGISDFFSDTFPVRDELIRFSRSLEKYKGFSMKVNGVKYEVLPGLDNPAQPDPAESTTGQQMIEITFPPAPPTRPETPESTAAPAVPSSGETSGPAAETSAPAAETSGPSTGTSAPAAETTAPAPETSAPAAETTAPNAFRYVSLSFRKSQMTQPTAKSFTVQATLTTAGEGVPAPIVWSVSDPSAVLMKAEGSQATLMPLRAGTYSLTAEVGGLSARCTLRITAAEASRPEVVTVPGSLFLYNDALYQTVNYSGTALQTNVTNYTNLEKLYGYYWPDAKLYLLPAPHAAVQLNPAEVAKAGRDHSDILRDIAGYMPEGVTLVDAVTPMKAHIGEYLYFRTDHHWTQRGAYYGYTAFAKAAGWTPVELSSLQSRAVRTDYIGPAYYNYAVSKKITPDTLEVFYPSKKHTMQVYYNSFDARQYNTPVNTFDSCITDSAFRNFHVFLAGDIPWLHINVPENGGENGKRILVIFDSYGRPFLPFLCEHYGSITAVCPRDYEAAVSESLRDLFGDRQFDDILFVMNVQTLYDSAFFNAAYRIIQP